MKLFLSSYKFGKHETEFAQLAGDNKKVAVIMNAVDWGDPERASISLLAQISILESVGLEAEQLDLRNYFDKPEKLRNTLLNYGLLWVHGGNTFVLKRAYEKSGLDLLLKELLLNNKIVYGGFSAGVAVLTPTLRGIEIVDDPKIIPEGYDEEYDISGLGIIDYVVAMHFDSDHPESRAVNEYILFCKKNDIRFKKLRDGEVLLINGNSEIVLPIIQ